MSGELLGAIPMVLAWAAVVYKLPALCRSLRDPAVQAYWASLLCLALTLTVLLPPVYLALDGLLGVPNLARLLGNGLALLACWMVQIFLFHLNYPADHAWPKARRAGWWLAATLALMTVFFTLAPVDEEAIDFVGRYGDVPFVLEYRLAFFAYSWLALITIVRLAWRYGQLADRPALRLGMRLVAVGGGFGFAYMTHDALRAVAARAGLGQLLPQAGLISQVLMATTVSLMLIGATMPAWGPRVGVPVLYGWVERYRAHRRLYPLWRALYQAAPEIALLPPPSALADALAVRDLDFRLYRRVVEIRDGSLALRRYLEPQVVEEAQQRCQAAGLSDEEAQAVVEAASLAAALQARVHGRAVDQPLRTLQTHGGGDVTSEVRHLEGVARAYQHSPIVRTIRARIAARAAATANPSTPGVGSE